MKLNKRVNIFFIKDNRLLFSDCRILSCWFQQDEKCCMIEVYTNDDNNRYVFFLNANGEYYNGSGTLKAEVVTKENK